MCDECDDELGGFGTTSSQDSWDRMASAGTSVVAAMTDLLTVKVEAKTMFSKESSEVCPTQSSHLWEAGVEILHPDACNVRVSPAQITNVIIRS